MVALTTERLERSAYVVPDDARGVLEAVRSTVRARRQVEAQQLALVLQWAHIHAVTDPDEAATWGHDPVLLAGEGCPMVDEACISEIAAALGLPTEQGRHLMSEVLELAHRLPKTWRQVQRLDLDAWRARRIARATGHLSPDAARFVDTQVWSVASRIGPTQLDRVIQESLARFDPVAAKREAEAALESRHVWVDHRQVSLAGTSKVLGELDFTDAQDLDTALTRRTTWLRDAGATDPVDVLRARALGEMARADLAQALDADHPAVAPATLYVHVSTTDLRAATTGSGTGIARVEQANRTITHRVLQSWLADMKVTVKPVVDLADRIHVTQYEIPDRLKEQVHLRDVQCVFPWCTRRARGCDTDHITPYDPGDPGGSGGPTATENLAPECRHHHRLKTHAGWTCTVLEPGTYLWRSPHGYHYLRNHHGTTDVTG